MDKKSLEILARTESLILWDYLAETGERSKRGAINKLYSERKLSENEYYFNCPFCEYLRHRSTGIDYDQGCGNCIWPGAQAGPVIACNLKRSPLMKWSYARTESEHKQAAKEVFDLIWDIEI